MGNSPYSLALICIIFEEKTAMEIQPEFIEQTTQQDKSFRRIGIILKIVTLAVAFFAIAMMSI